MCKEGSRECAALRRDVARVLCQDGITSQTAWTLLSVLPIEFARPVQLTRPSLCVYTVERLMISSDEFLCHVCNKCGLIGYPGKSHVTATTSETMLPSQKKYTLPLQVDYR